MRQNHLAIMTRFELGRLIKSAPGILFLAIYICAFVWLGMKLLELKESLASFDEMASVGASLGEHNPVVMLLSWIMDMSASELHALTAKYPPALIILFGVTVMLTPVLVLTLSMDQTGSDISRRHARYLVVRADRRTLYTAKTLSLLIFWALALFLGVVVVAILASSSAVLGDASLLESLPYLARIWACVFVLGLPFIALSGMAAAMAGHATIGGVITFGLWAFVALSGVALGWKWDAAKHIGWLFPTHHKYDLLSDDMGTLLPILGYQVGYAVVAFLIGIWIFSRRDV